MANKTLHPKKVFDDLISLLYPRLCMLCDAQVQKGDHMCISCENNLPTTDYHTLLENPITEKFYGRVKIEFGAAYYIFGPASKTQKLIHELKYNNKPQLGEYIGRIYGDQLKESPIFPKIDYIVPVPLHPMKMHQRGYNQSEAIAKGLSESLHIPIDTKTLIRTKHTNTQTKKSRLSRMENVGTAFGVSSSEKLEGKHIILLDDVLTTGATLEACALTLLEHIPTLKISIITMATGE